MVEHLELGTELNLLAREIRGPRGCPNWVCLGGQTLQLRVHGAVREESDPRESGGAWGRDFEPTSPRLQRGAFTRLASQANSKLVRPTGIEPVPARGQRAALPLSYGRWCTEQELEPAEPEGT